jgi:hypothetical protein
MPPQLWLKKRGFFENTCGARQESIVPRQKNMPGQNSIEVF